MNVYASLKEHHLQHPIQCLKSCCGFWSDTWYITDVFNLRNVNEPSANLSNYINWTYDTLGNHLYSWRFSYDGIALLHKSLLKRLFMISRYDPNSELALLGVSRTTWHTEIIIRTLRVTAVTANISSDSRTFVTAESMEKCVALAVVLSHHKEL